MLKMEKSTPFEKLLSPSVQDYISQHIHVDISQFLLKKSPFPEVSPQEIATQIKGKKVASKKFPSLDIPNILFPPQLNLEQTSSETTAKYKSQLVEGERFIDLTTGFGIDAFFLQKKFQHTTLVERNDDLLALVAHNWRTLGAFATYIHADLEEFLKQNNTIFDCIYLDPARRNQDKRKVFLLEDLSPNILAIMNNLLKLGKKILIKLSPLIDIHYLLSQILYIQEIHLIAVKNEMKEVLLLIENTEIEKENVKIVCANLETSEPIFTAKYGEIEETVSAFGHTQTWLYMPNSTLQKAGATTLLGKIFELQKLHPNTQLLTGKKEIQNFPGRKWKVQQIQPKSLKKGQKANIISKNYPMTPEQIKNKYKLKDGGEQYLIFTQDMSGKIVLQSI